MSEPSAPTPRPGGRAPQGRENVFTHKIGPLPMWAWVGIAGGGLVAWRLYSNKNAANQAAQSGTSTSSTDTSANTVPQFVNQTYVSTTAPASSGTDSGPATPVNPAPTGTSTQPKPTTTLPGSWHYPAPSGLALVNQSAKGVSFSWDAVTGPSGQHPNSYTIATYDTKGKLVDEFSKAAGDTSANEFGKGGKGLPKGTYHTNVWANGGPVAPPHSTVQYTLKG
jgi:hypothetical protein